MTADRYELPLAVAESARELAEMTGYGRINILSAIAHDTPGTQRGMKFIRIEVPVEDGESKEQTGDIQRRDEVEKV